MDWNLFWTAFAAAMPAMLTALAAFIQSLRNSAATKAIHTQLNSRLSELVEAVRLSAHSEGVVQGASEERARKNPPAEK